MYLKPCPRAKPQHYHGSACGLAPSPTHPANTQDAAILSARQFQVGNKTCPAYASLM